VIPEHKNKVQDHQVRFNNEGKWMGRSRSREYRTRDNSKQDEKDKKSGSLEYGARLESGVKGLNRSCRYEG